MSPQRFQNVVVLVSRKYQFGVVRNSESDRVLTCLSAIIELLFDKSSDANSRVITRTQCHSPFRDRSANRLPLSHAKPNRTQDRRRQSRHPLHAATHGIYSVTPVLPRIERQVDWLDHRARVFAALTRKYMRHVQKHLKMHTNSIRHVRTPPRAQVRNRQRNIPTDLARGAVRPGREG